MANAFKSSGSSNGQNGPPIYIYANAPSSTPASVPDTELTPAPNTDVTSKEEEAPVKRYKQIHQYWSEFELGWVDRKDEERTPEEEAAAKKLLFVCCCSCGQYSSGLTEVRIAECQVSPRREVGRDGRSLA